MENSSSYRDLIVWQKSMLLTKQYKSFKLVPPKFKVSRLKVDNVN